MDKCSFFYQLHVCFSERHPDNGISSRERLETRGSIIPYLFLLVAQGLAEIFYQVARLGEFNGFTFNMDTKFDILQFVADTILFCDGDWSNLWSIKAILWGLKLISGLKVNLSKSKIVGMNL